MRLRLRRIFVGERAADPSSAGTYLESTRSAVWNDFSASARL